MGSGPASSTGADFQEQIDRLFWEEDDEDEEEEDEE